MRFTNNVNKAVIAYLQANNALASVSSKHKFANFLSITASAVQRIYAIYTRNNKQSKSSVFVLAHALTATQIAALQAHLQAQNINAKCFASKQATYAFNNVYANITLQRLVVRY